MKAIVKHPGHPPDLMELGNDPNDGLWRISSIIGGRLEYVPLQVSFGLFVRFGHEDGDLPENFRLHDGLYRGTVVFVRHLERIVRHLSGCYGRRSQDGEQPLISCV